MSVRKSPAVLPRLGIGRHIHPVGRLQLHRKRREIEPTPVKEHAHLPAALLRPEPQERALTNVAWGWGDRVCRRGTVRHEGTPHHGSVMPAASTGFLSRLVLSGKGGQELGQDRLAGDQGDLDPVGWTDLVWSGMGPAPESVILVGPSTSAHLIVKQSQKS